MIYFFLGAFTYLLIRFDYKYFKSKQKELDGLEKRYELYKKVNDYNVNKNKELFKLVTERWQELDERLIILEKEKE